MAEPKAPARPSKGEVTENRSSCAEVDTFLKQMRGLSRLARAPAG